MKTISYLNINNVNEDDFFFFASNLLTTIFFSDKHRLIDRVKVSNNFQILRTF